MTPGSLLMGQGRDLLATWLAGGQGAAGGPSGPYLVLAGGVAGTLAGFAAACLGARSVAGFVAAVRSVRQPPDGPRRSDRAAATRPATTRIVICAGVAAAAALAIAGCGGQPGHVVGGTGGWSLGPPAVGAGAGLLLGAAGGTLVALGLHSPRGVTRTPTSARLVDAAVACLPDRDRRRWHEEWRGELSTLPSRLARTSFCLSLLLAAPRMGWTLRSAAWRRRGG